MEKAILKTLIYADIFDYPLKIKEIHKWLIGKKITPRQAEKALKKIHQAAGVTYQGSYYFLPKRNGLVGKRIRKEKQSVSYFRKAKILSQILKLIPWIKLVGVSGGLALNNAGKSDDIDLFIITSKNRLWISRLLALGLLSLTGQRRKVGEKGRKIAGKLCFNTLLEEDKLEQKNKDIFVAHEVLQMRPLWYRNGSYSRYLEDNSWAFQFLPNWIGSQVQKSKIKNQNYADKIEHPRRSRDKSKFKILKTFYILICHFTFCTLIFNLLEKYVKKFQLWYMQKPQGLERIEDGALYFHPEDYRIEILAKYMQKLKKNNQSLTRSANVWYKS